MFDLSGKTALVTGASGGIGKDIARALVAAGATVALSGTRREALEALAAEIGGTTHVLPCNLADKDETEKLVPAAETAMGGVDILVNNAGVTRDMLFMRMKDEDWNTVLDINLTSAFRLSRAVLRGMMKKRFGRIIGITSVVGVTVNCVAPGLIESPMTDGLTDAQKERILSAVPAGRLGTGADVAAAVVYLASVEAGYVTGQTLHVNGGMAMI